jgi:uncharacterized protein (TIGR00290 family)
MHGVREELLNEQAKAIGIPLHKIILAQMPAIENYETKTATACDSLKKQGFNYCLFGDIFLEDLRAYRENQLAKNSIKAVFPLWNLNSTYLVHEFIDLGFKAVVVCVNAQLLDKSFAGRVIDRDFLKDLPENIDRSGENGEFHTFVFDGPLFKQPVTYTPGEKVFQSYTAPINMKRNKAATQTLPLPKAEFWFCDLLAS